MKTDGNAVTRGCVHFIRLALLVCLTASCACGASPATSNVATTAELHRSTQLNLGLTLRIIGEEPSATAWPPDGKAVFPGKGLLVSVEVTSAAAIDSSFSVITECDSDAFIIPQTSDVHIKGTRGSVVLYWWPDSSSLHDSLIVSIGGIDLNRFISEEIVGYASLTDSDRVISEASWRYGLSKARRIRLTAPQFIHDVNLLLQQGYIRHAAILFEDRWSIIATDDVIRYDTELKRLEHDIQSKTMNTDLPTLIELPRRSQ